MGRYLLFQLSRAAVATIAVWRSMSTVLLWDVSVQMDGRSNLITILLVNVRTSTNLIWTIQNDLWFSFYLTVQTETLEMKYLIMFFVIVVIILCAALASLILILCE